MTQSVNIVNILNLTTKGKENTTNAKTPLQYGLLNASRLEVYVKTLNYKSIMYKELIEASKRLESMNTICYTNGSKFLFGVEVLPSWLDSVVRLQTLSGY